MRIRPASLLLAGLVAWARPGAAAPEDRGPRGFFVGGGPTVLGGTATDHDGRRTPAWHGAGFELRFGEEALPGLTLGLELQGGQGSAAEGGLSTALGGFLLQVGWRPSNGRLALWAGTGFGGGQVDGHAPRVHEGATGGAIHGLAVSWDFPLWGAPEHGGALSPVLGWTFAPAAFGSDVGLNVLHLGVELTWYAGR
jgi:hypothetical protein